MRKAKSKEKEYPKTLETFRPIGFFELSNLKCDEPTSFNGWVQIKKYRITVEEIEEPTEVLVERVQHLWDICDNYHQWVPLRECANSLGYELKGDAGNKREKK